MITIISRIISIYQEKGAATLIQRVLRTLRRDTYFKLYCKLLSIIGEYSLTIEEHTVTFSAPNAAMVRRNQLRFRSEKNELVDFLNEIEEDDVVYDIGANTGLYTLFASKVCPAGEVIAFEPYPPNLGLLKQDITRNKLQNIETIEMALSDSVGDIEFSQPDEDDVGYGSSAIESNKSESTIEVPTTTGDQLVADKKTPQPNVVKIDVEGSESLVVDGLETTLSAPDCRMVYCEVHLPGPDYRPSIEEFGSSPEKIRNRLENFGFTVEVLDDGERDEIFYKAHK
jgi:FkbM family methyltransferase